MFPNIQVPTPAPIPMPQLPPLPALNQPAFQLSSR